MAPALADSPSCMDTSLTVASKAGFADSVKGTRARRCAFQAV